MIHITFLLEILKSIVILNYDYHDDIKKKHLTRYFMYRAP